MYRRYQSNHHYENCYPLNFNNFSKVTFTNNRAFNGGAVYVGYNINIKSTESSTLTFRNNQAHIGGAIYSISLLKEIPLPHLTIMLPFKMVVCCFLMDNATFHL